MRVARLLLDGRELAALEHRGTLYRVDRLDDVLGVPIPTDLAASAPLFHRRVFSLGMAGLAEHDEALREGTRLDDAKASAFRVLAPAGVDPSVLELPEQGDSVAYVRVNGRALFGHEHVALYPPGLGPLLVAPAVAIVLGEDVHVPSIEEARRAPLGCALALAWSVAADEAEAMASGLGRAAAREVGTHLGPFVHVARPLSKTTHPVEIRAGKIARCTSITIDPERVAKTLVRAGRFGDLRAGDVLLFTSAERIGVEAGVEVMLHAELLGELRGTVGRRAP